jgi:carbonic anhydrase
MRTTTKAAILLSVVGVLAPVLGGAGSPGHENPPESHEPAKAAPAKTAPAKGVESKTAKPSKPATKAEEAKAEGSKSEAGGHEAEPESTTKAVRNEKTEDAEGPPSSKQALKWLREGNSRWTASANEDPNISSERRTRLAEDGQKPFASIITCADSRLPVERIFDRGVGDLFVVRVAGNIAGRSEIGTIEYGVGHLNTPLLVVMGHTKCGAVAAAATGAEVHGAIADLVSAITPAVERAKRDNPNASKEELAAAAVKENVWQTVFDLLKSSEECREAVRAGKLSVVGAVCDISTGKVEFLGEHPWQSQLIDAFAGQRAASAPESGH